VTDRAAHSSDPEGSGFRVLQGGVLTVVSLPGSGKTTSALLLARFAAERAQFFVHRTLREHFGLGADDTVLTASLRRTTEEVTGLPAITASPEAGEVAAASAAFDYWLSRWAGIGQSKQSGLTGQWHSHPHITAFCLGLLAAGAALEQFLIWVDAAIASTLCDERYEFIEATPPTATSPCGVLRRSAPQEPRAPGASCPLRVSSHPVAVAKISTC
jgi:hypothetical protein